MEDKNNYTGMIVSWTWSIILLIFNIVTFVFYFNGNNMLLTISGILNIIDTILFSKGKGLIATIFIFIGALFIIKNVWYSLCFALLIENTIASIIGIFVLIYANYKMK